MSTRDHSPCIRVEGYAVESSTPQYKSTKATMPSGVPGAFISDHCLPSALRRLFAMPGPKHELQVGTGSSSTFCTGSSINFWPGMTLRNCSFALTTLPERTDTERLNRQIVLQSHVALHRPSSPRQESCTHQSIASGTHCRRASAVQDTWERSAVLHYRL